MILRELTLKGYRNYTHQTVALTGGVNVFKGENAQGKTNLLEAVYFLGCGKSFRTHRDADLIHFDQQKAYIKASYTRQDGQGEIEALLMRDGKKSLKINARPVKKLTELFGHLLAVVFSPEELKVLKESPALRRKFVDMELSKLRPAYLYDLQSYDKAMQSKNALLRSNLKEEQVRKLAGVFNQQIAQYGSQVIRRRASYLKTLDKKAKELYARLTEGRETLDIRYAQSVEAPDIEKALYEKLEASFKEEMACGYTVAGPHREDFGVQVDGQSAKAFASQGQQRTAMLAVKLASAQIVQEAMKEAPVVLLDDVLSELDMARQEALLRILSGTQVLLTTALETPKAFKQAISCEYAVSRGNIVKL